MQISNINQNKNNNRGFTLVELVIVISGIAALGSFTIPNVRICAFAIIFDRRAD